MHKLFLSLLTMVIISVSAHAEFVETPDSDLTMNDELYEDVFRTLQYLSFMHYLPNELNDEYSSRTLDSYLELLDPNKVYFTQADITRFNDYRYKLDDHLKKRDAEPAFSIFKQYRQRLHKRTELIMSLIQQDFDFTKDEYINIDKDNFVWANNEKEISERWRKRIKNDVLVQLLAETELSEIRDNLRRRYQRQRDVTFQLKADEVFEWFMNAYTKELEPHTQYMSHITSENFRINMSLSLEGIGAALQTEQDYTVINRIIPGGPADLSDAIKPEDKIVGVGQADEKIVNVIGWRLMDVVQMIRGKKDTKVTLQVQQNDSAPGSPPTTIQLTRDVIQLEDQAAKLSSVDIPNGDQQHHFSVISIPSFYSNQGQTKPGEKLTATTHDVKKLLKKIDHKKSEGLVIDLRGNGGGYLTEAISLTGLFIPQGPVVQVVESNRKRQILKDQDKSVAYDGPLVVLVDRYSASASEIFAAAMQDYGRAIVVGERSFGKGTVQRVAPLRYGQNIQHESQIKFTTAQFFRVNGGSTQHKGVIPDITLNAGTEDEEFGERAYDNALPWSETSAATYQAKELPKQLFGFLSKQHQTRSQESPAFSFLRSNYEAITRNKNIKQLSLNMKQRRHTRDQLETASLSELNVYRTSLGLKSVTKETKKDNPLPDEDEHWNIIYHTEAARILLDSSTWSNTTIASKQTAKNG